MRPPTSLALMLPPLLWWLATAQGGPAPAARPRANALQSRFPADLVAPKRVLTNLNITETGTSPVIMRQRRDHLIPRNDSERNTSQGLSSDLHFSPKDGDLASRKLVKRMNKEAAKPNHPPRRANKGLRIGVLVAEFALIFLLVLLVAWLSHRATRSQAAAHAHAEKKRPTLERAWSDLPPPPRPTAASRLRAFSPARTSSLSSSTMEPSGSWNSSRQNPSWGALSNAEMDRPTFASMLNAMAPSEREAAARARAARMAARLARRPSQGKTPAGLPVTDALEVERAIARQRRARKHSGSFLFRPALPPLAHFTGRDGVVATDAEADTETTLEFRGAERTQEACGAWSVVLEAFTERPPPARRHSVLGIVLRNEPQGVRALPLPASLPDLHLLRTIAANISVHSVQLLRENPVTTQEDRG